MRSGGTPSDLNACHVTRCTPCNQEALHAMLSLKTQCSRDHAMFKFYSMHRVVGTPIIHHALGVGTWGTPCIQSFTSASHQLWFEPDEPPTSLLWWVRSLESGGDQLSLATSLIRACSREGGEGGWGRGIGRKIRCDPRRVRGSKEGRPGYEEIDKIRRVRGEWQQGGLSGQRRGSSTTNLGIPYSPLFMLVTCCSPSHRWCVLTQPARKLCSVSEEDYSKISAQNEGGSISRTEQGP
jgi:hypothetical protein